MHRRNTVQSPVSRYPKADRVRESNSVSHLCILLIFEEKSLNFLIQKPSRFSHTGVWGGILRLLHCFLLAKFGRRHYSIIFWPPAFFKISESNTYVVFCCEANRSSAKVISLATSSTPETPTFFQL